ncbi:MAG TPA: agmatinase [Geminicoccaceae bacterium]|nr:agmatinase [Geminicoccaceae bacterium]
MTRRPDVGAMFHATETETFLGLPQAGDLAALKAKIAILGAPCATPYRSVGPYCAGAPKAIRDAIAGYAANLHHIDFDIGGPIFPDTVTAVDGGDLPCTETDPAANRIAIRRAVATVIARGAVPIVIGGDDSVPIPVFEAFHDLGPLIILQIDAHIDWREEVAGERLGLSSTMRRASEMPHVERIVQVGQRAIGSARPGDFADAKAWGAIFVPAREVHEHGIASVLDAVPAGSRVLVTLDCDGLDPAIMPAVLAPAPGGLTYWQTIGILRGIAAKARIAAFDLVEFVPEHDLAGLGALTAARIVVNVLGLVARQADSICD